MDKAEYKVMEQYLRDEGRKITKPRKIVLDAFRHSHHDHLRCERCGKIIEFHDRTIEKAQEAIFDRYGFTPLGHRMELIGLCPGCAASVAAGAEEGKA